MYVDRLFRNGKLKFYPDDVYRPLDSMSMNEMMMNELMFKSILERLINVLNAKIYWKCFFEGGYEEWKEFRQRQMKTQ